MLPLEGVRVVEVCQVAAGPFCGMLLADLGADVVKVEHPDGGDGMRQWPPIRAGFSENFASLNRNKRSVALDLKRPDHLARALDLVLDAEVLIENSRPGVMDRLGLGYAALHARQPALVYCSISAYGQAGPRAQQGGYDLTIQAAAGVMSVTGEPAGAPVKCGVPLSDFASGLYAALAIASALRAVERGGEGQHIDVPMLGATLAIAALQTSEYFGTGRDPRKLGSAHPRNAPYQAFRAADGHFAMAAGNDALWHAVCRVVGREDLVADTRFRSPASRAAHQRELREMLEREFAGEPCASWVERFVAAGVPCAPINTYSQALADPQVEFMEWVRPLELPGGVVTRTFASPLRLSGERLPIRRAPPALGAHTEEVFAELAARPRRPEPGSGSGPCSD